MVRRTRPAGPSFAAAVLALAAITGLTACASDDKPEREIGAAQAAISHAESANAPAFAPAELYQARQKLDKAQGALRRDDNERAKRLADEATVDAQLAQAKAQEEATKRSLEEIQHSIDAMRSRSKQDAGPGVSPAISEPTDSPWREAPT